MQGFMRKYGVTVFSYCRPRVVRIERKVNEVEEARRQEQHDLRVKNLQEQLRITTAEANLTEHRERLKRIEVEETEKRMKKETEAKAKMWEMELKSRERMAELEYRHRERMYELQYNKAKNS